MGQWLLAKVSHVMSPIVTPWASRVSAWPLGEDLQVWDAGVRPCGGLCGCGYDTECLMPTRQPRCPESPSMVEELDPGVTVTGLDRPAHLQPGLRPTCALPLARPQLGSAEFGVFGWGCLGRRSQRIGLQGIRFFPSNWRIVRVARSIPSMHRALTETGGGYCVDVRMTATPQIGQKCCPPVTERQT